MTIRIDANRKIILVALQRSIESGNVHMTIESLTEETGIEEDAVMLVLGDLISEDVLSLSKHGDIVFSAAGLKTIQSEVSEHDEYQFSYLLNRVFKAQQRIEIGFLDLAESIYEIQQKRLYRMSFSTFEEFCEKELGYTRQTLYIYFSILELIHSYPRQFPRDKALALGQRKLKAITQATRKIDKADIEDSKREKLKQKLFKELDPSTPARDLEKELRQFLKENQ